MPQNYSPTPQQREFLRLLLLKLAQDRQLAAASSNQPSKADDILSYIKRGKDLYDNGQKLYNVGSSIANAWSGPAYSEASQVAWNQAAGGASQAAWNAGADAATTQAGGAVGESAGSSTAADAAPWLAAANSAYNSYKRVTDKNARDEQQAYDAAMSVPRAVAAYYTLGLSDVAEGFARKQWGGTMKKLDKFNQYNPASPIAPFMAASRLWTSDKWKAEGNRLKKLVESGINIPDSMMAPARQTRGRKKSELINPYLPKDFVGDTPQYGWVNNKFANSRNESDLTGKDIWGYAGFLEKFGNDWLGKMTEQQREAIANKALERGAVREHHGTVDINWTPELERDVATIRGQQMIPKVQRVGAVKPGVPVSTPVQPAPEADLNRKGILSRLRR